MHRVTFSLLSSVSSSFSPLLQTHSCPLLCVMRAECHNDRALAPSSSVWWLVPREEEEEEEEAGLWSVLGGEVEQPLAQQGVVLFQVLYKVGLLFHHLLQAGALSEAGLSRQARDTEGV